MTKRRGHRDKRPFVVEKRTSPPTVAKPARLVAHPKRQRSPLTSH